MNTPLIEPWQVKTMHTLLSKLGLMSHKIDIMDEHCVPGHIVGSSKELYYEEANRIIKFLQAQQNETPDAKAMDRQRKKIISHCREIGWNKGGKADMYRINEWAMKYGSLHKPLNAYTGKALSDLVTAAEKMRDSFLKAQRNG